MSQTEADQTAVQEPFSLTLDQYGRIWLHTKLEGIEVALDLADKDEAFAIMADKMAECGFEYEAALGSCFGSLGRAGRGPSSHVGRSRDL